jgi:hypothetical protein
MNLNVPVLDLSGVISMLAAIGSVTGLLAVLRILFLDRLLSGLDSAQQNILLRAVLILLNFGAILGLAVLLGALFDRTLVTSVILATLGASAGSHLVFTGVKATVAAQGIPAPAKVEAPVVAPAADWPPVPTDVPTAPQA